MSQQLAHRGIVQKPELLCILFAPAGKSAANTDLVYHSFESIAIIVDVMGGKLI